MPRSLQSELDRSETQVEYGSVQQMKQEKKGTTVSETRQELQGLQGAIPEKMLFADHELLLDLTFADGDSGVVDSCQFHFLQAQAL